MALQAFINLRNFTVLTFHGLQLFLESAHGIMQFHAGFIKAVIEKAMSPAVLKGYTGIMESIAGNFETSMPYDMIAQIVRDQLENGGSWNIVTASVDGYGDTRRPYSLSTGAYVMVPYQETVDAAIAMMEQVKNGEILG